MWKWIIGAAVAIVLIVAGTCYAGYKRITSGGNTVRVAIAGDASRIFALLTDRDSMRVWMTPGTEIVATGTGAFQAGDTIRISTHASPDSSARRQTDLWVVRELRAPDVFVIDAIQFTPAGEPHVVHTRRDSLAVTGDSATVVSTFIVRSMFPDDPAAESGGRAGGVMMGVAQKMMVGAIRMMWQSQLTQLKRYVEGG